MCSGEFLSSFNLARKTGGRGGVGEGGETVCRVKGEGPFGHLSLPGSPGSGVRDLQTLDSDDLGPLPYFATSWLQLRSPISGPSFPLVRWLYLYCCRVILRICEMVCVSFSEELHAHSNSFRSCQLPFPCVITTAVTVVFAALTVALQTQLWHRLGTHLILCLA